jgi:integrase
MPAKADLRLVKPTGVNGTVPPRRVKNAELRTREYLAPSEVDRLIEAAKHNRHGTRDALMLLMGYRHGLRAAEVVDLRWSQVDFDAARLHVRRVKGGTPSVHPLKGDEMRALRRLRKAAPHAEYVFASERGSPFAEAGFAKMVARASDAARLEIKAHAHMLRHACGHKLANDGVDTRSLQAYLGHKDIKHTTRYTDLAPTRFKDFWRD